MNNWIDRYRAREAKKVVTDQNAHRNYLLEYLPRVEHLNSQIVEYLHSIETRIRIGWPSDFTHWPSSHDMRERKFDLVYFPYWTHLERGSPDYLKMRLDDALTRLREASTHVEPICRIDSIIYLPLSGANGGIRIIANGCGRRTIFTEIRKIFFIRHQVRRSDGHFWIDSSDVDLGERDSVYAFPAMATSDIEQIVEYVVTGSKYRPNMKRGFLAFTILASVTAYS